MTRSDTPETYAGNFLQQQDPGAEDSNFNIQAIPVGELLSEPAGPPLPEAIISERAVRDKEIQAFREANVERLDEARADYARVVNSAQLFGAFLGRRKKLEAVTDTYRSAWQIHLADQLAGYTYEGLKGAALATALNSDIYKESQDRTNKENEDWDRRKYTRVLDRYHGLSSVEKFGAGLVVGAATSGLTLALGGAAAVALGATATVRVGRALIHRESRRNNLNAREMRMRDRFGYQRTHLTIGTVAIRNPEEQIADQLGMSKNGRIVRKQDTVLDWDLELDSTRDQIKAVKKSIAISVGSIALGATLSHASDIKNALSGTGNISKIAGVELPKMTGLTEKTQEVAHKIGSIGLLKPFVELSGIKITPAPVKAAPTEQVVGGTKPVIEEAKERVKTRWQTVKEAPKSLWVRSSNQGDYSYFPNRKHNSYWELAKQTLRLNGEARPTVDQINDLKNAAITAQGKDPATATLDIGDKVTFRARMIRAALGRS